MELKHTPKPFIEEHYHIQELIERQEKRTRDRVAHQEKDKLRDITLKDIAGFKDIELLDFWCEHCKRDFVGRAKKQIDLWCPIAFYKIKHRCGSWCMRHITDRPRDPYFYRSMFIARQRQDKFNDALQPFQTGFNTLYGKK